MATGKGLLTSLQRRFLALFGTLADQEQFYLTGGTALAEYYLGHRLSFDLDLFTGENNLVLPMSYRVEQAARKDPGFDLYWMAVALNRAATFPDELDRWPVQMLSRFEPARLKAAFGDQAQHIMHQLDH